MRKATMEGSAMSPLGHMPQRSAGGGVVRCAVACAASLALLAGCAAQMDTPPPRFGEAFKAAKDAQRINPVDRDDGLRPLVSELPAGVMAPSGTAGLVGAGAGQASTWGGAGSAGSGSSGSSGLMILPAGR